MFTEMQEISWRDLNRAELFKIHPACPPLIPTPWALESAVSSRQLPHNCPGTSLSRDQKSLPALKPRTRLFSHTVTPGNGKQALCYWRSLQALACDCTKVRQQPSLLLRAQVHLTWEFLFPQSPGSPGPALAVGKQIEVTASGLPTGSLLATGVHGQQSISQLAIGCQKSSFQAKTCISHLSRDCTGRRTRTWLPWRAQGCDLPEQQSPWIHPGPGETRGPGHHGAGKVRGGCGSHGQVGPCQPRWAQEQGAGQQQPHVSAISLFI